MIEIAKEAMAKTHARLDSLTQGKSESVPINLVTEFNKMTSRVLLMCAIGEDVTDLEIDYWQDGQTIKKSLSDALRQTFQDLTNRIAWPRMMVI